MDSFRFFTGNLFVKRDYDILFYYPAHFNRAEGKNPFFEPLYKICDKNGISYLIIEEPYYDKKTERNDKTVPFDFPLIVLMLFRKIIPIKKFEHRYAQDRFIARILKPLLFKKLTFRNAIVLSNSMISLLRGINEKADIYDYQHGVIFLGHKGYFTDRMEAARDIRLNRVNLLLYGQGFQKMLHEHDASGYYKNHTFVLGFDVQKNRPPIQAKDKILFTLQFTGTDEFGDHQDDWLKIIEEFFDKYTRFFQEHGITVLLKKHPRHNDAVDISSLYRYPFTTDAQVPLESLFKECFLHLTFYSSSLFDASAKAIPTILWQHQYSLAHTFVESFHYPLGVFDTLSIAGKIEEYLTNESCYEMDRNKVATWYDTLYQPLDEKFFVEKFSSRHMQS